MLPLTVVAVCACHGLLDVSDPTLVQDKDIANVAGANARRLNVFVRFNGTAMNLANDVAIFTDEREMDLPGNYPFDQYVYLDQRNSEGYEAQFGQGFGTEDPHLGGWDEIFTKASIALPAIRAYSPDSVRGDFLAQMHVIRAYAVLQVGEDVCPGFPINDIVNNVPIYGLPFTNDSAFKFAIMQADSALAEVQDSTQFKYFAQVLKGRALLDLGRYQEVASTIAGVPPTFTFVAQVGGDLGTNYFYIQHYYWDDVSGSQNEQMAVGNLEGRNGLPFAQFNDPRVGAVFRQTRYSDPTDSLYDQNKYASPDDPMVLASGLEVQLMQAEVALNAGDVSGWLGILNALRTTAITPSLPQLADPGIDSARVSLLYSERAFWLYLTGHRLGDLRRMIRNYGRDPESIFPTGRYPLRGGNYGTATAIPFIQTSEQRYNPNITSGCTTR